MQYRYTIFYVNDVLETINFYHKAFGFEINFITPEKDYAELQTGETTIAFASSELGVANFKKGFQKQEKNELPCGVEIAFVTENIVADFQTALDAGAELFEDVVEKPWGQKVGYLRDCNGFLVEICTPVQG